MSLFNNKPTPVRLHKKVSWRENIDESKVLEIIGELQDDEYYSIDDEYHDLDDGGII